jgi:hypothetical protein
MSAEFQFCIPTVGKAVPAGQEWFHEINLERLLRGRPDGIFVNPFEVGAIGPDLFEQPAAWGWRV